MTPATAAPAQPHRSRRRGRLHQGDARRRADAHLRGGADLYGARDAARRDRRQELWLRLLARLGGEATEIAFTRPYVTIEGVFVVAQDAPWHGFADIDQPGVRISVGRGAAYDLHLSRILKHAELVRVPTSAEALAHFVANGLEAGAGIRQPAAAFVASQTGLRLIEEPFMPIQQAMAVPVAEGQRIPRLQDFLDDAARTALLARALALRPEAEA